MLGAAKVAWGKGNREEWSGLGNDGSLSDSGRVLLPEEFGDLPTGTHDGDGVNNADEGLLGGKEEKVNDGWDMDLWMLGPGLKFCHPSCCWNVEILE